MGKWTFVRLDKNKQRKIEKSGTFARIHRLVNDAIKMKRPSNIEQAIEIGLEERAKYKEPLKARRLITIPKKSNDISLVSIFVGLAASGVIQGDPDGILKGVMAISKARNELAEGSHLPDDIEIYGDLTLKPYKAGLALYTRT